MPEPGFEYFIENEDSDYNDGVMVNKYGDYYSLIAARKGKDGNAYKDWCFPRDKDKQPREKAIPLGVKLGKREQSINTLAKALELIGGPKIFEELAKRPRATAQDDDIPW